MRLFATKKKKKNVVAPPKMQDLFLKFQFLCCTMQLLRHHQQLVHNSKTFPHLEMKNKKISKTKTKTTKKNKTLPASGSNSIHRFKIVEAEEKSPLCKRKSPYKPNT